MKDNPRPIASAICCFVVVVDVDDDDDDDDLFRQLFDVVVELLLCLCACDRVVVRDLLIRKASPHGRTEGSNIDIVVVVVCCSSVPATVVQRNRLLLVECIHHDTLSLHRVFPSLSLCMVSMEDEQLILDSW